MPWPASSATRQDERPQVTFKTPKSMGRWLVVLGITLAFFYGMDQLLMSAQGLPLGWTMAPRG